MKMTAARFGIRVAVVATAVGVAVGLTGCLQSTSALPGTSPTAGPSSTAAAPSAAPTSSSTPSAPSTAPKFTENCSILLNPAQVYAYNPNFVADGNYAPKAGTIPASIAANSGQTCGWVNESSGSLLEVAIATPLTADLAAAKAAAASGTPIQTSGENGFFAVKNGIGSAQFFFGSVWLDVSSQDFGTAADAQGVYSVVVANQLHAGG